MWECKDDPEWSIIVNPVLSDTKGGINGVSSGPLDTSFADEFNNENKDGEDIAYDNAFSDEQEKEAETFSENIRKRKNTTDTCADKVVKDAKNEKTFVTKSHKKRSVARSQLQAMNQLAAGINRLTEVNAISPSEFTPTMSSSTPPFSSVNRIATFSNRFQPSSTQPAATSILNNSNNTYSINLKLSWFY